LEVDYKFPNLTNSKIWSSTGRMIGGISIIKFLKNIVHIGIRITCSALLNPLFHAIWHLTHLVIADIPLRMLNSWFFLLEIFAQRHILLRLRKGSGWLSEFNATFSNISAIPWRPVLVVEEAGVPGENHRPWASNW
jgi:hypothetical protein